MAYRTKRAPRPILPTATGNPPAQAPEARFAELQTLHEISQAILTSPDLGTALSLILDRALAVGSFDLGAIRLFDSGKRAFEPVVSRGYRDQGNLRTYHYMDPPRPGIGNIVQHAEALKGPIVLEDLSAFPWMPVFQKEGVQSALLVPVRAHDVILGTIQLGSRTPRKFQADEIRLFEAIGNQMGIAVQKARLLQAAESRTRHLSALYAIASAVNQSLQLDVVLQEVIRKITEIFQFETTSVFLADESGELHLRASFQDIPGLYALPSTFRKGEGIVGKVIQSGEPQIFEDVSTDPRYLQLSRSKVMREIGFSFFAAFPIKSRLKFIGAFVFHGHTPRRLSDDEIDLINSLTGQIGVAVENLRLFEQTQRAKEEIERHVESLNLLISAAQKLVAGHDPDALAHDILQAVVTTFGMRLAWIGRAEPDGLVRPLYWVGEVADYVKRVEIRWDDSPLGQGPAGRAIRTGRPVVMDVATDPGFAPWREPALAQGFREVAAFPLMRDQKPFGHLILYSDEPGFFTNERVNLLETYTNIATGALENARLLHETESRSGELSALYTVSSTVNQTLELDEILQAVIAKITDIFKFDATYIYLPDPWTEELNLRASYETRPGFVVVPQSFARGGGVMGKVAETGEPIVFDDALADPLYRKLSRSKEIEKAGLAFFAVFPIKSRLRVLGVLAFCGALARRLKPEEIHLITSLADQIGVAFEKMDLVDQTRKAYQELQTLYDVSQSVLSSLELKIVLEGILDKTLSLGPFDLGNIRLFDPSAELLEVVVSRGYRDPEDIQSHRKQVKDPTTGEFAVPTLLLKRARVEEDVPGCDGLRTLKREGTQSAVIVPVRAGEEVLGILQLGSRTPRKFKPEQIHLLEAIGSQLGVAVQKARLFDEAGQRSKEQSALYAIAETLAGSLNTEELVRKAVDKIAEVLAADDCAIRLIEGNELVVKAYWNRDGAPLADKDQRRKLGEGVAGHVADMGQALVIERDEPTPSFVARKWIRGSSKILAAAPILIHGKVVGTLGFGAPRLPSTQALEFLQAIGNQIGVALEKARLYEQTEANLNRVRALREVEKAVTSNLEIEKVLPVLLEKIEPFLPGHTAITVRLCAPPSGKLELAAWRNLNPATWQESFSEAPKDCAHEVFESGELLLVRNVQTDSRIGDGAFCRTNGFASYLGIPLVAKGERLGVLGFYTREEHKFADEEVNFFSTVASHAAIAIQNARLYKESQDRAREQEALNAIAMATNQSAHLDELLQVALDKVLEVTDRECGYIRLKDPVSGGLALAAHRGISEEYINTLLHRRTLGGKSDQVFKSGEPLVVNDAEGSLLKEEMRREENRCIAWIPLKSRGNIVGILNVGTSRFLPFQHREVELLKAVGNVIGVAIEKAELFRETERRAKEQEVLNAVAMATSQSLHLDEILQIALDKVLEVSGRERGYVRLKDPVTGELRLAAHRGISEGYVETLLHRRTPGGKSDQVFQSGEPVVINDPDGAVLRKETRREGQRALVWIPLKTRDQVVGILNVSTDRPIWFTPRDVELLQAIGNVIGVALENALLYEETERRAREQEVLNAITMATSQSLRLDELLQTALDKVLEVTGRERGYIRLRDSATGQVSLAAHHGISEEYVKTLLHRRTPGGKTDQVFQSGEPLVINDPEGILLKEETRREGSRSIGWFPLKAQGKVVGVLNVATSRPIPFEPREVELLQAIGNVIGVAVENAALFEDTTRNLKRIRTLRDIDAAIASTLDRDVLLNVLLEKIDSAVPFPIATTVRLLGKEADQLEPVVCRNLDIEEWKAGELKSGRGPGKWVVENRLPLSIANVQTDPRTHDKRFFAKHGLVSYLGVPLIAKEEVLGVLGFYTKEPHDFTKEEVEFLMTLAGQAAIAIHKSQLYEETKHQAVELQRLNKVKDEFLSVMSHELRTPLTAVMGYAAMMQDGILGSVSRDQKEALEKMEKFSKNLLSMIESIMEATKIEARALVVARHAVSLKEFFDEFRSSVDIPPKKRLRMIWDYPADLPVVETDREKLKRIVENLISNAVKFTNEGIVLVSARIREGHGQRADGNEPVKSLELKVKDTGMGIPGEMISAIFKRFRQVDSSETRAHGGIGLGLYIVKSLTELLGGQIEVKSEPGKGSTFIVRIPCGVSSQQRAGGEPASSGHDSVKNNIARTGS